MSLTFYQQNNSTYSAKLSLLLLCETKVTFDNTIIGKSIRYNEWFITQGQITDFKIVLRKKQ
jgi:hypothetical protein